MHAGLRVYVLGKLVPESELAVLAEFRGYRAVARHKLTSDELGSLTVDVRELHLFAETGAPAFDADRLRLLGSRMFKLLIDGDVRRVFDRAASVREGGQLLPLELILEDNTLASWPWEYLYDASGHSFLCQEFHPIIRGVFSIPQRRPAQTDATTIRIGVLIGVLDADNDADPEEELRWIREVFKADLATGAVHLEIAQGLSSIELETFLQENTFHILHFFGHARFDTTKGEAYLRFDVLGAKSFRLPGRTFANLVTQKQSEVRLVFLNACESGRTDAGTIDPARSAIAAALIDLGVPTVIATQFSIPDVSSHHLAALIYKTLAGRRSLLEAVTAGRRAMQLADEASFFDWGIPILYTSNPDVCVFPKAVRSSQSKKLEPMTTAGDLATSREPPTRTAAFVDLDAKAGFLPDLVAKANAAQRYFSFQVSYRALPLGATLTRIGKKEIAPQLLLSRVEQHLQDLPRVLSVDQTCCLTASLVAWQDDAGTINYNYFAWQLASNPRVSVISVAELRTFAKAARVEYSKVLLLLCLSQLLRNTDNSNLEYHEKTHGCLFDRCDNRADIVVGLRKMKFDHKECRAKVKAVSASLLDAVDALVAL